MTGAARVIWTAGVIQVTAVIEALEVIRNRRLNKRGAGTIKIRQQKAGYGDNHYKYYIR